MSVVPMNLFVFAFPHDALVAAASATFTLASLLLFGFLKRGRQPIGCAAPQPGESADAPSDDQFLPNPPGVERRTSSFWREREQQIRIAFKAARLGTWTWDPSSGEVVCDSLMKSLYGLPLDGSANRIGEFFARIHPDDIALVGRALDETIENGSDYNVEFRAIHPDGSFRWLNGRGTMGHSVPDRPPVMVGINLDIHTRKTAELALQESERQFHTLADSIPQLAWMADSSGHRFWNNSRWYEYSGATPEEMTADSWQSSHHPEELPGVIAQWRWCTANSQAMSMECRLRNREGVYRWFLKRAIPITDSSGRVTRWFGTDTEITEIRESRDALRESENQFKQIADSMPQLVWVTRSDGWVVWWNKQWHTYTGKTLEELGGEGWPILYHPDDIQSVRDRWGDSLRSGMPLEVDARIRRSDGFFGWFLIRGVPVRDSDGSIVKWFGTCTYIEDYKLAEAQIQALNEGLEYRVRERTSELAAANQELAYAQAQLQAILHSVTRVSIIITDRTGVITMFNKGAERLLQYDASEVVGTFTTEVLHSKAEVQERSDTLSRELCRPIRGFDVFAQPALLGMLDEREWTYVRKDGTTLDVSLAVSAIRNLGGSVAGYLGIANDITRQKSLERELRENNAKLTKQTARAEEANLAKSTFLAAMSHEIRTPMNAILGMSDLLWESNLDDDQRQYVEVFRRAGNVLLDLINSILDLSKIEAGHLELENHRFDLEDVVIRAVELLSPKALAKGIRLFYGIASDVQTQLMGDSFRLQQILVNLVGNAVKFTESGEVVIRVYQDSPGGPGALDISVCDTGIGIPADQLKIIFEDFSQADSSTTRRYGGTGLGLGIAQRLISLMGGQLRVESEIGVGSVFHFTVALKPSVESREVLRDEVKDLHGLKIMVIDNNETNCLILRETLTSWGVNSVACATAEEGSHEILRAQKENAPYAMVLLDCQMPDIDGFSAVPLLRQTDARLPIVMLSSDSRPGDAEKRARAGLSGYAVRPVKRADLLQLICSALGTARQAPNSLPPDAPESPKIRPVQSLRILIAEDSPDNRLLLQVYLKKSSHVITFADNGAQAVEQFLVGEFDLILMDMQMPVMDGLAATRAIRVYERAQNRQPIPIVALTANALAHDAEASYQAGCNAHLSKPVSKQRLLSALEDYGSPASAPKESDPIFIAAPEGMEEFVPQYLVSRKLELPVLQRFLFSADFDSIQKRGHDLKGTGTAYGFSEISRLGAELELSAKSRDEAALVQQLDTLSEYLNRVQVSVN